MALDHILETIRSEAAQTASEAVASAEEESERLLEQAREEAAREEERLAASLDDRARLERNRIISRARLDASRNRRGVREEIYQDARQELARRLLALRSSPEYQEVLASLLDEALAVLPSAREARVDPADVDTLESILSARDARLSIRPEECAMGGLVVAAEGRSVDNRLESRLERIDHHLRFIAGELIPELRGGSP